MDHTDIKASIQAHKNWRNSLVPLDVGTVVQWVEDHQGASLASSVKAGQTFKIKNVRECILRKPECDADKVYDMVLVSKNGREYTKKMSWSVESVAREMVAGTLMLQLKV
jgi:hypothetical protein